MYPEGFVLHSLSFDSCLGLQLLRINVISFVNSVFPRFLLRLCSSRLFQGKSNLTLIFAKLGCVLVRRFTNRIDAESMAHLSISMTYLHFKQLIPNQVFFPLFCSLTQTRVYLLIAFHLGQSEFHLFVRVDVQVYEAVTWLYFLFRWWQIHLNLRQERLLSFMFFLLNLWQTIIYFVVTIVNIHWNWVFLRPL